MHLCSLVRKGAGSNPVRINLQDERYVDRVVKMPASGLILLIPTPNQTSKRLLMETRPLVPVQQIRMRGLAQPVLGGCESKYLLLVLCMEFNPILYKSCLPRRRSVRTFWQNIASTLRHYSGWMTRILTRSPGMVSS
jgi:hypothetical protein